MTRDQFISAASKGQGRAILALRSGEYAASMHDLRRLVLRWTGYDLQMESHRGRYTVDLMNASGFVAELTDVLLRFAYRIKGRRWDVRHREAVVEELARRGVDEAKEAIYRCFDPAHEFRYADAIIEVDGLEGLGWVIAHSTGYLVSDEAWRLECWIEDLEKITGKKPLQDWLKAQAADRPEIAEFLDLAKPRTRQRQVPRDLPMTYDQVRAKWEGKTIRRTGLLMWSRNTTRDELRKAWREFESEQDEHWLAAFSCAFARLAAKFDIEKILVRARNWNAKRNPFAEVLEEVGDPRVRQLGFDLLAEGWKKDGFALIVTNAVPGDQPFLAQTVRMLTDPDDIHSCGLDLMRVSKDLDSRDLLLWVYEETPCSFCRESAVRDLLEINAAPEWLLRECLSDCVSETREMAGKALSGGDTLR